MRTILAVAMIAALSGCAVYYPAGHYYRPVPVYQPHYHPQPHHHHHHHYRR